MAEQGNARIGFELLGPLRATEGTRELALGPVKQRAVLGVLLMRAGQSVPRDEIVAGVWGARPPASAHGLVATYVAGLRRVLEPLRPCRGHARLIVSSANGYLLRAEPDQIDLGLFEAEVVAAHRARDSGDLEGQARTLSTALARWRGAALDGLPGPHAEQARDLLAERHQLVLEERIEVAIDLGEHAEWVSELTRLATAHPLRETLARLRMLALYRSGRQAEALMAFREVRQNLVEELGVEPSAPLCRLHQQILTGELPVPPARARPATVFARVPQQMPADIGDFTGRGDEIGSVLQILTADGPRGMARICVLTGPAGIGKTALAVRLAHLVADRFPDGLLYIDLRGTRRRCLSPYLLLGRLLTDLGVAPDDQPGNLEERSALVRTLLAGRRMLLLFDDAKDGTQLRPALPGAGGSAVVITSRRRITDLAAAHLLHLGTLDDASAAAMFSHVVGAKRVLAEPEASAEVLRRCGGLPLALRVAAARLAGRPDWTIGMLRDRLADDDRRLDELATGDLDVRSRFLAGYRALRPAVSTEDGRTTDLAAAFRLLGALPGVEVGLHTAAAVLGTPIREAERALEFLADVHLVELTAPGRYRLHDLVHLFAAERALRDAPGTRQAALRRAFEFYRVAARRADLALRPGRRTWPDNLDERRYRPPFQTAAEAVDWLETERRSLIAVARATAAGPDANPDELAGLLTDLRSFLHRRGHWQDWYDLAQTVRTVGQRAGRRRAEAVALLELGTFSAIRRLDPAVNHLEDSVRAFHEVGDELGQGRALNNLAVVLTDRGEYGKAARALHSCLRIHERSGDPDGESITLDNLGLLHLRQGHHVRARTCCIRSIRLREEAGSPELAGAAFNILGRVHSAVGSHSEALYGQQRSLALARAGGNRYREAYALADLGSALCAAGEARKAVEPIEAAWELRRALGDEFGQIAVLRLLGEALHAIGDHRSAAARMAEADQLNDRFGEAPRSQR